MPKTKRSITNEEYKTLARFIMDRPESDFIKRAEGLIQDHLWCREALYRRYQPVFKELNRLGYSVE